MCKKIKAGEGIVRMSFYKKKVTCPLLEPQAFLREAPVCKKLTPELVPIWPKNYRSMLVPCHDTMPSFMIFKRVLELQEFKNQGHTCDFSTNFGALEHVLVVQIWIMHIKWPEIQLMYKKGQMKPE